MGLFSAIGSIFGPIGTVVGAAADYATSKKSSKAGKAAMAASDPFGPNRTETSKMLMDLMKNPESVYDNPLFKSSMDAGSQAVSRAMGSQWGSGQAAGDLYKLGQSSALNFYHQQEDFLAKISGAYTVPNAYAQGLATQTAGQQGMAGALGEGMGGLLALFKSIGMGGAGGGPQSLSNGGYSGGMSGSGAEDAFSAFG